MQTLHFNNAENRQKILCLRMGHFVLRTRAFWAKKKGLRRPIKAKIFKNQSKSRPKRGQRETHKGLLRGYERAYTKVL